MLSEHPELTDILEETNSIFQTGATRAPLTVRSYFTTETQSQQENFFHDSDEGAGNSTGEVEEDFFDNSENDSSSETEENRLLDKEEAQSNDDTGTSDHSGQDEQEVSHFGQTGKDGSDDSE